MTRRRPAPSPLPRPITVTVETIENPPLRRRQWQELSDAWTAHELTQNALQGAEQATKTA
ncbi:hypothetical protein Dxin01_04045 [Deinococcus xinjiangensis]|uniref:Uncharacterized protein n=1 Tax=Deinococcus xinjiangensis TaxID=457454 RepID=A0ABP9VI08_9DEIO